MRIHATALKNGRLVADVMRAKTGWAIVGRRPLMAEASTKPLVEHIEEQQAKIAALQEELRAAREAVRHS